MRNTLSILCLMTVLMGLMFVDVSFATPPRKPSASQFSVLVSRSPFTIRASSSVSRVTSPLEKDWMLGSIRPNTDGKGWAVTLINKKDRKNRVRFLPGFSADGFELLEVDQNMADPKASKVRVRQGSQTAWISYDENLIKVRSSASGQTKSSRVKQAGSNKPRIVQPAAPSKGGVVRPVRKRYTSKENKP